MLYIDQLEEKLYYISDIIINANKGELMTVVLTLADYLDDYKVKIKW